MWFRRQRGRRMRLWAGWIGRIGRIRRIVGSVGSGPGLVGLETGSVGLGVGDGSAAPVGLIGRGSNIVMTTVRINGHFHTAYNEHNSTSIRSLLSMPTIRHPVISNGCQCLNGVLEAIKDMDIPGYITREDFSYSTYIFRELRTSQVRVVRGLTGLLS